MFLDVGRIPVIVPDERVDGMEYQPVIENFPLVIISGGIGSVYLFRGVVNDARPSAFGLKLRCNPRRIQKQKKGYNKYFP
jgi:hypothetical protein